MAKVKIEDIVDRLDSEFKKALSDTVQNFSPDNKAGQQELFRFFLRRVSHYCSTWENVPDQYVQKD